jgi:multiple sugar transport system substrate-binding protein
MTPEPAIGVALLILLPGPKTRTYPKRIPVRFWHMLGGEWTERVDRVAERFNRSQTKYEVIPLLLPSEDTGDSKFLLSVAGGDPPDVMLHWTQAMSTWAEAGLLQPLDTLMTPEEKHRFLTESYPTVRKNGWYGGHLVGITEGFDLFAVYYRPSDLRAIGLDHFPRTFEELLQAAQRLNGYDSSHHLTRLGYLAEPFLNHAPAYGGQIYDEASGRLAVNSPANLRALTDLVDWHRKLGFDNVLRYKSGLGSDGANLPFIAGKIAMNLDGEWNVMHIAKYAPDLKYDVAPLPPPKGGIPNASFSSVNYLVIPRGAKQVEGAWEFIKFMTGVDNPERAAEFYPWFGWLPMSPRQAATPIYQDYLRKLPQYRTFVKLAESDNIVTTPPVPYQLYLMDRIGQVDTMAESGSISPQQALQRIEADVAKEIAQRKELGYVR